ncbi:MAG: LON peptidase substrate-binding domain-containing protein, partial [Candidatus Eisenbacteria bacterium]
MDQAPKRPVPVFPLPGVVLFPGATMNLHVFELRYRTMVRDALSSERLIALATLAPGYELDYHGSPPFHELGCVARFDEVEWLPNDHYELRVTGLVRARFGRRVREFPYRSHVVEALPEAPYTEDDPMAQMARQGLLEQRSRLGPLGSEAWLAPPVFEPTAPLMAVVGTLATTARLSDADKLELLAEDDVVQR